MLLCRFQEIPLKIYKETLTLKKTSQNNKDTYNFDDFNIGLVLMKTGFAPLMSTPDIEGEIVGKFQFAELGI
jgi:hypothetical protein